MEPNIERRVDDLEGRVEEIGRRELSLPLYFSMTVDDVDVVCEELLRSLDQCYWYLPYRLTNLSLPFS